MCSFATIFGLAKLSGGKFRLGINYDQHLRLSEIFPYFEKYARNHVIEAMYCGKACNQIDWKNIQLDMYKMSIDRLEEQAISYHNLNATGSAMDLGIKNLNSPLIYKQHLNELREKIFVFKDVNTNNAQVSR